MKVIVTLITLITLSACSSLPDLKVGYYLPKSYAIITVNHTIACKNPKDWEQYVLSSIDVKDGITADKSSLKFIQLDKIDEWYSTSEIEIALKDDGRLSAINSANSSNVTEYIDKIVTLGASLVKSHSFTPDPFCEYVSKHPESKFDEDSKIYLLHLKLKGVTDFTSATNTIDVKPINFTESEYEDYIKILGTITATFSDTKKYAEVHFINTSTNTAQQNVEFKIPKLFKVNVALKSLYEIPPKSKVIEAPHLSQESYYIPIPAAPLFGKNGFSLALNDKSKITKIKYSSDNSGASGFDALNKLYSLKETDAEELEKINTEISLIKAREKLAICRLDITQCSE